MPSQLPYNVLLVLEAWQASAPSTNQIADCVVSRRLDVVGVSLRGVAFSHACVNPFLYVFCGVRFRSDLQAALRAVAARLRPSVMSDSETTPPSALSL